MGGGKTNFAFACWSISLNLLSPELAPAPRAVVEEEDEVEVEEDVLLKDVIFCFDKI